MPKVLAVTIAILVLSGLYSASPVQAQSGTDTKITFGEELEEQAREQLLRLLSKYDLDPWILTDEVRIEAGKEPHSMPILTLNTDFLDDDEMQLSIFLHEQAHWFVDRAKGRDAATKELQKT